MKTAPFKLRSGNKPEVAKMMGVSPAKNDPSYDREFEKKQEAKKAEEEKKQRAIMQGKIANWNKKNPNATQEELNAYIQSLQSSKK